MTQFLRGTFSAKNFHREITFASRCQNVTRRARRSQVLSQQSALRQDSLSSGPHVTDLGKGPLRELAAARRAWVGIEEDPAKNAEVTRSVGQVLVTTKCPGRATLLSCLSLDGDPEQARCSIMRSSMCLANECISVQLNYARF